MQELSPYEIDMVQELRRLVRERKHGQVSVTVIDGRPNVLKLETTKKLG